MKPPRDLSNPATSGSADGVRPTSLRSRLTKGIGAQAFSQTVNIFIQVASLPLFVHFWGVGLYGEWLVLSAVPAYLTIADLGFGTVSANEMTMEVGRHNRPGALVAFQSTLAVTSVLITAATGLLALGAVLLPIERYFNLSHVDHSTAALVVALLGGTVLVSQLLGVVDGAFRCEGLYGLGTFLASSVRLAEFMGVAATVAAGGSVVAVAVVYLAIRVVGLVAIRLVLRVRIPWIRMGIDNIDLAVIRRLVRPAIAFLGFPIGNAVSIQGMAIVISSILSPSALVVFAALRTLTRLALQAVLIVNAVVWPEIATAFGAGNDALVHRIHDRACQVAVWFSAISIAALVLFGDSVVQIWSHDKVKVEQPLFSYLLAAMGVGALWWTSSVVLSATNRHARIAVIFVVVNLSMIGLAIPAVISFGLAGAGAALLACEVVLAAGILRLTLRAVGEPRREFIRALIQPPTFFIPSRTAAS